MSHLGSIDVIAFKNRSCAYRDYKCNRWGEAMTLLTSFSGYEEFSPLTGVHLYPLRFRRCGRTVAADKTLKLQRVR